MPAGSIILLPIGLLVFILAVTLLFVRWLTARRMKVMRERFPNALRAEPANFYGQESRGVGQLRGNGILVLLSDQLLFAMLVPRREYTITRRSIVRTESPTSYLGRTNFQPLLKVVFQDETGKLDSMAWLVRDVPGWQAQLGTQPAEAQPSQD